MPAIRDPGPLMFLDESALILKTQPPNGHGPNTDTFGAVTFDMGFEPIQFIYSRPAIEFLNRASARYEIVWMTDLGDWPTRTLSGHVGLQRFPSIGRNIRFEGETAAPVDDGRKWWKDLLVRHTISATGRRFVWIDDQLTSRVIHRMQRDTVPNQCLLLPMTAGEGLQTLHFEQIANFVGITRKRR